MNLTSTEAHANDAMTHSVPAEAAPRVLLTVEAAAERLSIGRTMMYALVKSGDVESVCIGRLRRIPATALDSYARRLLSQQEVA